MTADMSDPAVYARTKAKMFGNEPNYSSMAGAVAVSGQFTGPDKDKALAFEYARLRDENERLTAELEEIRPELADAYGQIGRLVARITELTQDAECVRLSASDGGPGPAQTAAAAGDTDHGESALSLPQEGHEPLSEPVQGHPHSSR